MANLQSVLLHSCPVLPCYQADQDTPSSSAGPYFTLADLWQSYEEWSAYGCEVPLRICVDGVWQETIQCYTPYLSGIQLFGRDNARRIPAALSSASIGGAAAASGYSSEEESAAGGSDACSVASAYTCSTASTASTASDSEDGEEGCRDSPTCGGAAAARRPHRGASVLAAPGAPGAPLFEFAEAERPHLRLPLHDQVAELAAGCPQLLTLDTRDLHPASWFAVTWVPIYRIPGVPDPGASRDLQANFLTFHSLAVPAQRPHDVPDGVCSPAPLPPQLDMLGAAAVAWRTEVARQQLLGAALQQLAAQQARARSSLDGASSAGGSARSSLDGGPPKAPALPLAAACLRPFAFVPYKVAGRTWIDDWNLQRTHLPMIAAAGSWVARRKVQLPDFDFFSEVYRPLPSGYGGSRQ